MVVLTVDDDFHRPWVGVNPFTIGYASFLGPDCPPEARYALWQGNRLPLWDWLRGDPFSKIDNIIGNSSERSLDRSGLGPFLFAVLTRFRRCSPRWFEYRPLSVEVKDTLNWAIRRRLLPLISFLIRQTPLDQRDTIAEEIAYHLRDRRIFVKVLRTLLKAYPQPIDVLNELMLLRLKESNVVSFSHVVALVEAGADNYDEAIKAIRYRPPCLRKTFMKALEPMKSRSGSNK